MHIMQTIKQLQSLIDTQAGLLDIRSAKNYQQGHLKGTTNIPLAELPDRLYELADPCMPLYLLGSAEQLTEAETFFQMKKHAVKASFVLTDELSEQLKQSDLWVVGNESRQLWQANTFLQEMIATAESLTGIGTAIDLACGSGRDAVFLAARGWQTTAIDYQQDALDKCQLLAQAKNVQLTTMNVDIEAEQQVLQSLQTDLLIVMRYLHRPLFGYLKAMLNPGGFIIYQTFMQGCEKLGRPRNPNYLLKSAELAEHFNGLSIICDRVDHLADGRPVNSFMAQKKEN